MENTATTRDIDTGSVTTAEGRQALFAKAQETVAGAVDKAVEAVKANPKTAAAIAVGTTAAVAGAAYGATKLAAKESSTPAKKTTSTAKK